MSSALHTSEMEIIICLFLCKEVWDPSKKSVLSVLQFLDGNLRRVSAILGTGNPLLLVLSSPGVLNQVQHLGLDLKV